MFHNASVAPGKLTTGAAKSTRGAAGETAIAEMNWLKRPARAAEERGPPDDRQLNRSSRFWAKQIAGIAASSTCAAHVAITPRAD
jgi:hypothetical protein